MTQSPAIIAFGKTALSKFSHDVFRANIACSSRYLSRISFDSEMKASWSNDAAIETADIILARAETTDGCIIVGAYESVRPAVSIAIFFYSERRAERGTEVRRCRKGCVPREGGPRGQVYDEIRTRNGRITYFVQVAAPRLGPTSLQSDLAQRTRARSHSPRPAEFRKPLPVSPTRTATATATAR